MNRNPLRGGKLLTHYTSTQDKAIQDDSNEKVSLIYIYIGDKEAQLSLMDSIDINNIKILI